MEGSSVHQYTIDVEHAARILIEGIFHEEESLSKLKEELQKLSARLCELGEAHEFLAMNPELDDEGLAIWSNWEGHWGMVRAEGLKKQIEEVGQAIEHHRASASALSGALLQIAKQGISSVYGALEQCPNTGCFVGTQPLNDVIWQARNQSMHYEEGEERIRPQVKACFLALEQDFGDEFSLSKRPGESLAYSVVRRLGWVSFKRFATDLDFLLS